MAYKSSARGRSPVRLITGHTAEGARTARSLAKYFWRDDIMASSHVGIDAHEILPMVSYDRAAWTLRSGNPISDNAEMCGFARWSRAQWLSTGTVDGCVNPRQIVRNFAAWAKSRCLARGIPIRKLTVAQTASGQAGLIHHADWTEAMRDGSHWDCGPGFPWDIVLEDINGVQPTPVLIRPKGDVDMILVRGDSEAKDPSGIPYGYRVYAVTFKLEGGALKAERAYVGNEKDPAYRALLAAQGGHAYVMPQALLDAMPKQAGSQ
jgi:hypothetical protein